MLKPNHAKTVQFEATFSHFAAVSIKDRTCGCGKWQATSFPCEHAVVFARRIEQNDAQAMLNIIDSSFNFQAGYNAFTVAGQPFNARTTLRLLRDARIKPPEIRKRRGRHSVKHKKPGCSGSLQRKHWQVRSAETAILMQELFGTALLSPNKEIQDVDECASNGRRVCQ
jgi:hypothetical protein